MERHTILMDWEAQYPTDVNFFQISQWDFFVELDKLIPKFMLESSLKKNKVRRLTLQATKNYYRAIW